MTRRSFIKILKNIELNGEDAVPLEINTYYDEMGKNALIVALENKLYKAFTILINPIKLEDGSYGILFDPFSKNIVLGSVPLIWPYYDFIDGKKIKDYTNVANTKTNYCSIYSSYNYINHMKDDKIRDKLLKICMNIDHSYDEFISLCDIPIKDISSDFKIFNDEDVCKYTNYSMIGFISELFHKNIPLIKFSLKRKRDIYEMCILLDGKLLSLDNKDVLKDVMYYCSIAREYNYVTLSYKFPFSAKVSDIEKYLSFISGMFVKQELKLGIRSIDDVFNSTKYLLSIYGIHLDDDLSKLEKITVCMKANKYLKIRDNDSFYIHYDLYNNDIDCMKLKKES